MLKMLNEWEFYSKLTFDANILTLTICSIHFSMNAACTPAIVYIGLAGADRHIFYLKKSSFIAS